MLFWLFKHFIANTGDKVLAMSGSGPWEDKLGPVTPLVATLSGDGRTMFITIANGSWSKAVPMDLMLKDFAAKSTSAVVLTQASEDADPLLPDAIDPCTPLPLKLDGDRVTGALPPHAVVFMTIDR
jgi:hypothetical protein